jgi:hypothetical protein
MPYLTAVLVIVFGMASKYAVEMSSELSSTIFLDADTGVAAAGSGVTPDKIIDMRPEAALDAAPLNLPDFINRSY